MYQMTVSTFCWLVRPHLSANSLYSSRKSSIGWSISPVKRGTRLDQMDSMAPMPYAGAYIMAGVGVVKAAVVVSDCMGSGCSKALECRCPGGGNLARGRCLGSCGSA